LMELQTWIDLWSFEQISFVHELDLQLVVSQRS
jgi:hypothetical protein